MVFKYPKLIKYVEMHDITIDDIIKLIDTDYTILEFDTIGKRLKDIPSDKLLGLIYNNNDIIKYRPINAWMSNQLSTEEKIKIIQDNERMWDLLLKDHNSVLYTTIKNLPGEEISQNFDLFNVLRFPEFWDRVPDVDMRATYHRQKAKWDGEVNEIGNKELKFKSKVWNKSDKRIQYETNHELYIFNAMLDDSTFRSSGGKQIEITKMFSMEIVDPNRQSDHKKINMAKMRAKFEERGSTTLGIWVEKGKLNSAHEVKPNKLSEEEVQFIASKAFAVKKK